MSDLVSKAKLFAGDFEPREVYTVDYSFSQAIDIECQPAGIPRGGQIKIKVKKLNDDDKEELLDWMLQPYKSLNGKIEIASSVDGELPQIVEFEKAFCVNYDHKWEEATFKLDTNGGRVPNTELVHTETITLACKKITVGKAEHNNWEDGTFPATLTVDDIEPRSVMSVDYTFTQITDIEGQPAGIPRGGEIKLTVKGFNDGNVELLNWMLEKVLKKNGTITFNSTVDGSTMKEIVFTDAYCVGYTQNWSESVDNKPLVHKETITLSCGTITIDTTEHKKNWMLDEEDVTFPATLKADGIEDRNVMSVDYTYTQATDIEGQPVGASRGGEIKLKVKGFNDGNVELLNWMVDKELSKNGSIEFESTIDGSIMKTIEFEEAFCVGYSQSWAEATDNKPLVHTESITLSCRKITVDAVVHEKDWETDHDEYE